jgi:hypothetical protein
MAFQDVAQDVGGRGHLQRTQEAQHHRPPRNGVKGKGRRAAGARFKKRRRIARRKSPAGQWPWLQDFKRVPL